MNKFIISYPDQNDQHNGIVPFFADRGLILSHLYADIFDLLGLDSQKEVNEFRSKYSEDRFPTYYRLMDLLSKEKIRTVFCLRERNNELRITKGAKKLIAMAANNLREAHIIIVSTKNYGTIIEDDDQLYELLRQLDPALETAKCTLIEPSSPAIHILENAQNYKVWHRRQDSNPE